MKKAFFLKYDPPPPHRQQAEVASPTDSEDRTPGRLQAVWPPPKPKDEDEKVGLKYTEAGKTFWQCFVFAPIAGMLTEEHTGPTSKKDTPLAKIPGRQIAEVRLVQSRLAKPPVSHLAQAHVSL